MAVLRWLTQPSQYAKIRIMTEGNEWTAEFYLTENNESPVEEFLNTLDLKTRARFHWSMQQLLIRNTHARAPLVKHLDGDLWELREKSRGNIYRIIYFFYKDRRIVFLHGFQKKTQKTPRREIDTAWRRYHHFQQQQEEADDT